MNVLISVDGILFKNYAHFKESYFLCLILFFVSFTFYSDYVYDLSLVFVSSSLCVNDPIVFTFCSSPFLLIANFVGYKFIIFW